MAIPLKPRHEHDCESCRFLGQLAQYDIYVCPQGGHPTIVARHGRDGEYFSGAEFELFDLGLKLSLYKRP